MTALNASAQILRRAGLPEIAGRTALICGEQRVTYDKLRRMVHRAANAFESVGIVRGNRVALLLDDSSLYVAAILGLMQLGRGRDPVEPAPEARRLCLCAEGRASGAVCGRRGRPMLDNKFIRFH